LNSIPLIRTLHHEAIYHCHSQYKKYDGIAGNDVSRSASFCFSPDFYNHWRPYIDRGIYEANLAVFAKEGFYRDQKSLLQRSFALFPLFDLYHPHLGFSFLSDHVAGEFTF
jgi:hypothetical protein